MTDNIKELDELKHILGYCPGGCSKPDCWFNAHCHLLESEMNEAQVQAILDWHKKQVDSVLDRLSEQIKDTLTPDGKYLYILGDRYNVYSEIEREYDRPGDDGVDLPDWENIELKELLEILLSEHIDDIEAERKKL